MSKPDPDPKPDAKLMPTPEPNPEKKISDPQHWFHINNVENCEELEKRASLKNSKSGVALSRQAKKGPCAAASLICTVLISKMTSYVNLFMNKFEKTSKTIDLLSQFCLKGGLQKSYRYHWKHSFRQTICPLL
jgi:hypothetical protein